MKQRFAFTRKPLILLALCLSLASFSEAQTHSERSTGMPASIAYTGFKDNLLQFDVNLAGLPARSVLSITDEEGNLLHVEPVKAGNLNKRFLVAYGVAKRLRFEVYGKRLCVKQTFDIARQMEERVVVTASL